MNFLGFGQSAEIDIVFDDAENRKTAEVKTEDGRVENMLLYYDGETVSGKVNVTLKKPGSKLEHQGIKIEFIGQIELYYDRGNHNEFKCLTKALARHGDLIQNTSYPFEFPNVEKQFEVYAGSNVRLRYFLRATIVRRLSDITKEVDIAVHTLCSYPEMNNPIKMEVGIEDCLHIEFEYNKNKYHLKDIIIGKIYFLLVRIKIKHMEIAIIKRECTGTGPNMFSENETIGKFEIMDGAPVKGESIPIRVFLASYYLTPTMRDINKKFSVKYFLNLVLMDTEDRRYFKQQEITLWRKAELQRYQMQSQQHAIAGQHHHALTGPAHLVGGPTGPAAANMNVSHGIDSDSSVGASVATTSEGRMGLFTRESPNQDFSQQQDSLPTSPTTPTPPPTSAALSCATGERGMADGAAATNTSMLSSTPPPLPVGGGNSGSDAGSLSQREPIDFLAEDDEPLLVANTSVSAAAAAVGVDDLLPPPDHVDDGLTDVLLTSDAPETKATPVAVAAVPQAEAKKAVETVTPLSAD